MLPVLIFLTLWLAVMGGGVLAGAAPVAALVGAAAWLALVWRNDAASPGVRIVGLAGACFVMYLVITALPAPAGFGVWHGALRTGQNIEVLTRFEAAARLGLAPAPAAAPVRGFALSRNLGGTLRIVVLLVCALAAFMLAAGMGNRERRIYLRFLALLGVALAGAGYAGHFIAPQGHNLWWIIPVSRSSPDPVACFINRNHYAGFLALLLVASLAASARDLSARRFVAAGLMLAAAVIMAPALILTQSRGGLAALLAGLAATALCLPARRRNSRQLRLMAVYVLAAGLLLTAGALWLTPPEARERFEDGLRRPVSGLSTQTRLEAWRDTMLVWKKYPVIGAGANALRMVYPQHRLSTHRETRTHASNQYLQLLAETGIVGVVLAGLWALALVKAMTAADGGEHEFRVAAVGAIVVAAVHALVDFPHHVPLYAVVLASLAGVGAAGADRQRRFAGLAGNARMPAVCCLAAVLLAAPAWRGMRYNDDPVFLRSASMPQVMQAMAWAPTSRQAWHEFGIRCFEAQSWEAARLGEAAVTRAAELDPNNYLLWNQLGHVRLNMNDRQGAQEAFRRVRELRHWVPIPQIE